MGQQLLFEAGDVGEQALGDRCQSIDVALLEQPIFEAVEADETRILLALFEIIGAGVDGVVQLSQALGGGGQSLISRASR
ncbi:hypothetical protein D9M70_584920 [compost metagenome]